MVTAIAVVVILGIAVWAVLTYVSRVRKKEKARKLRFESTKKKIELAQEHVREKARLRRSMEEKLKEIQTMSQQRSYARTSQLISKLQNEVSAGWKRAGLNHLSFETFEGTKSIRFHIKYGLQPCISVVVSANEHESSYNQNTGWTVTQLAPDSRVASIEVKELQPGFPQVSNVPKSLNLSDPADYEELLYFLTHALK